MAGRVLIVMAVAAMSLSGCVAVAEPTQNASSSPLPLPAADSTNLAACRDAACEVEVQKEDEVHLDPGWRLSAIEVEYLSEEKITLWLKELEGPGGVVGGLDSDISGAEGHVSVTNGRPAQINGIELTMVTGTSARAILKMRPV
ncbi:hypothetical protein [Asanoa siamensis]|nr:hypothetical protein [Asanoa siamensis]